MMVPELSASGGEASTGGDLEPTHSSSWVAGTTAVEDEERRKGAGNFSWAMELELWGGQPAKGRAVTNPDDIFVMVARLFQTAGDEVVSVIVC